MVKYDEKKIPIRIATFPQEINRLIYVTCINKNVGNLKENLGNFQNLNKHPVCQVHKLNSFLDMYLPSS